MQERVFGSLLPELEPSYAAFQLLADLLNLGLYENLLDVSSPESLESLGNFGVTVLAHVVEVIIYKSYTDGQGRYQRVDHTCVRQLMADSIMSLILSQPYAVSSQTLISKLASSSSLTKISCSTLISIHFCFWEDIYLTLGQVQHRPIIKSVNISDLEMLFYSKDLVDPFYNRLYITWGLGLNFCYQVLNPWAQASIYLLQLETQRQASANLRQRGTLCGSQEISSRIKSMGSRTFVVDFVKWLSFGSFIWIQGSCNEGTLVAAYWTGPGAFYLSKCSSGFYTITFTVEYVSKGLRTIVAYFSRSHLVQKWKLQSAQDIPVPSASHLVQTYLWEILVACPLGQHFLSQEYPQHRAHTASLQELHSNTLSDTLQSEHSDLVFFQ